MCTRMDGDSLTSKLTLPPCPHPAGWQLAMKWYPNYAGYLLVGQRTFFNITSLAALDKRVAWVAKPECQDAPAALEGEGCDSNW